MKNPLVLFGSLMLASFGAWAQAVIPLTDDSSDTAMAGELAPVPGTDGSITSANAATADRIFIANLSGFAVVPPQQTEAGGALAISLNPDGNSLHYRLAVNDIQSVVGAQLRLGLSDENGPIVATLLGEGAPGDNITLPEGAADGVIAEGDITAADLAGPLANTPLVVLMQLMRAGAVYANVQTSTLPGGELRGQIRGIGPDADALSLLEGMSGIDDQAAAEDGTGTGAGTGTGGTGTMAPSGGTTDTSASGATIDTTPGATAPPPRAPTR